MTWRNKSVTNWKRRMDRDAKMWFNILYRHCLAVLPRESVREFGCVHYLGMWRSNKAIRFTSSPSEAPSPISRMTPAQWQKKVWSEHPKWQHIKDEWNTVNINTSRGRDEWSFSKFLGLEVSQSSSSEGENSEDFGQKVFGKILKEFEEGEFFHNWWGWTAFWGATRVWNVSVTNIKMISFYVILSHTSSQNSLQWEMWVDGGQKFSHQPHHKEIDDYILLVAFLQGMSTTLSSNDVSAEEKKNETQKNVLLRSIQQY